MTATSLPAIVLRNGVRIEDALGTALDFVEHDGSYQSYDLASVQQDDLLTESDIRVANAMIARMSARVIADIHSRASVINAALAQVPASASLATAEEAIPWRALEGLMRAVSHLAGASLPARVIHRYRLLIVGSYAVM